MRQRHLHHNKRGFALVAVLWVMTSVAIIGASLTSSVRDAVATSQNRVDLLRASWRAEGCAEAARSAIDAALSSDGGQIRESAWSKLDTIVSRSELVNDCKTSLRPSGTAIDINSADTARIRAVLTAIGQTADHADSLISALLDWQKPEEVVRAYGDEHSWYFSQHRPGPRNGPIASIAELRLVRGFDQIGGLDSLFGVDDERIDLNAAPLAVLASLPGFDSGVLGAIEANRSRGALIQDLNSFASMIAPRERAGLLGHYPELVKLTTSVPDAWTLTDSESVGSPPLSAAIELRLVNSGSRVAIVRRRSWP